MKAKDVMTSDVVTCKASSTLADCASTMKQLNVGVIPIVDDECNLIGILTDRDIAVRAVAMGVDSNTAQVGEFMTPNPVTIDADMDVEDAADLMADNQVRRLLVCDDSGALVGIISLGDLAVDVGEEEMIAETLEEISIPTR